MCIRDRIKIAMVLAGLDMGILTELIPTDQSKRIWHGLKRVTYLRFQRFTRFSLYHSGSPPQSCIKPRCCRSNPEPASFMYGLSHLGQLIQIIGVTLGVHR